MEPNKKLGHLSEQEIEELVCKYEDKNIKLSDIISEYKIDVKPAGLLKILPPVKTENICMYCNSNMYHERESRTHHSYNTSKVLLNCPKCGHKQYSNNSRRDFLCECTNCIEYRNNLVFEQKRNIEMLYGGEKEKLNFTDMRFQDQVDLIYVLVHNPNDNIGEILQPNFYFEDKDQWIRKINRLLEIGAISISPISDISAFKEEDFPHIVYIEKAIYQVNTIIDNMTLEQINNNTYFRDHTPSEEKLSLLKNYIYDDAIKKFQEFLEERRLSLNIVEEANNSFIELINRISYTQLVHLCLSVAKYFSDNVITGKISRNKASDSVLINVSKFYNNAINNNWILKHSAYELSGKSLKFFVIKILGKKLEILKECVTIDLIESAEDIGKSYDESTKKYYQ